MPSDICPPRIGTLTIKEVFILSKMRRVLIIKTPKKDKKKIHSALEKDDKTKLICVLDGNLPVILDWRIRLNISI